MKKEKVNKIDQLFLAAQKKLGSSNSSVIYKERNKGMQNKIKPLENTLEY